MSLLITNIQRMCLHDGPGIRTTVFLKGCSIHCPWCANPENIIRKRQYYFDESKCKNNCNHCEYKSECIVLKHDISMLFDMPVEENISCPVNAIGIYGDEMLISEAYNEIIKDRKFWINGGGVTFSGGEPLLQIEELSKLMKQLKEERIHITVETALFITQQAVRKAMEYVDLFIIDVKILDSLRCKEVLGGTVEQYLKNVELLVAEKKDILFRVPCSDDYTLSEKNMNLLLSFFAQYSEYPIEIFKLHNMAQKKYKTLGKTNDLEQLSNNLDAFYQQLKMSGNIVSRIEI